MKKLIAILICLVVYVLFFFLMNYGLHKHEQMECEIWATQSQNYPLYYFVDWQRQQCQF